MKTHGLTTSLVPVLIALAACSAGSDAPAGQAVDSVPAALAGTGDLSQTARALELTGIDGIFASEASYTLLAPVDSAFARVEGSDDLFEQEEALPALAALLRQHILPGYVTPEDLTSAISASPDGNVAMLTMDGSEMTFTMSSDQLQAASPDGATAILSGDPVSSQTSIAIPVNAFLIVP